MLRVISRRVLLSVPLLLVVSVLSFVLSSIAPGDVARSMLSTGATPEAIAALNKQLGLDQPVWARYGAWLGGALHGDLGNSVYSGQPVSQMLTERIPVTLSLTVLALLLCVAVGVSLGFLSAIVGGFLGRAVDALSVIALSLPNFWLGALLISIVSVTFGLLPASGYVPIGVSASLWFRSLILPVLVLSASGVANLALTTRGEVISLMQQDWVKALRANGIPARFILFRHLLRNAGGPVATIAALLFVALVGGTVVIENVFGMAGLGSLAVDATNQHDLPVIQGIVVFFTLVVVAVFLLTDLVTSYLNPKVRAS